MSTSSKSPRKVAVVALENGKRNLPTYGHRNSRKDFTQPQLFACLVLRKFFKTDYRGVVTYLGDMPQLCDDLGLKKVPHFTTLQKAEGKLLRDKQVRSMLGTTVGMFHGHGQDDPDDEGEGSEGGEGGDGASVTQPVGLVAADSTGYETHRCSRYFVRRRSSDKGENQRRTYRRFGKMGLVCECDTHLILATHRGQGPKPDTNEMLPLLEGFCPNAVPEQLLADAGYDSEANHELLRDYMEIDSLIPPSAGRPTDKLPTGKYRYAMTENFDEETYGQRWQSETVMYMNKQHQGPALTARSYQPRRREMGLMAITHNTMIVYA